MTRTTLLPGLLLLALGTPALGQRAFVVVTEEAADRDSLLDSMRATVEQYHPSGRRILAEVDSTGQRGHLVFMQTQKDQPLPTDAKAVPIDSRRSQVMVLVEARRDGAPVGAPVTIELSLRDLNRLRTEPEGQRNTLLGSMIRNRWATVTAGLSDPGSLVPVFTPTIQFKKPDGATALTMIGEPIAQVDLDDLLGKVRRPDERIRAAAEGKDLPLLRSISPGLDQALEQALVKVRLEYPDDTSIWSRLTRLRSGKPRRLTEADREFLRGLLERPTAKKQAPEKKLPQEPAPQADPKGGAIKGLGILN